MMISRNQAAKAAILTSGWRRHQTLQAMPLRAKPGWGVLSRKSGNPFAKVVAFLATMVAIGYH